MEDLLKSFWGTAATIVEGAAALLITIGAAAFAMSLLRFRPPTPQKMQIWMHFAAWRLLGLEFELAADVIRTAIAPTWSDMDNWLQSPQSVRFSAIFSIRTLKRYRSPGRADIQIDTQQWICQRNPLEECPSDRGSILPSNKTGEHMGQPESSPTSNEPTSNQLAADRTWMAQERTLMAWIRTATSMISFGFTIYKFFEGRPPNPHALLSSRDFAILMIGFGLVALMLATIQHLIEIRSIAGLATRKRRSIALVLVILLAVLGTIAFVSAVFRK